MQMQRNAASGMMRNKDAMRARAVRRHSQLVEISVFFFRHSRVTEEEKREQNVTNFNIAGSYSIVRLDLRRLARLRSCRRRACLRPCRRHTRRLLRDEK